MDASSVEGLDGSMAIMEYLEKTASEIQGIEFLGDDRVSGVNNADIIRYHAEGIETKSGLVQRDITASDEDNERALILFADEVERQALRIAARKGDDDLNVIALPDMGSKQATATVAKGLKAAAEYIRKKMVERAEQQIDNKGNKLKSVDPDYAEQRNRQYGTPADSVLKATGELLSNLSRVSYKFTRKSK